MPIRFLVLTAIIAVMAVALALSASAASQRSVGKHRVVFEVTTQGQDSWEAVLNNVQNLQKAFGAENTEIEVVAHGNGLGMLVSKTAEQLTQRMKQIADSGVVFAACENTMRRKNVSKSELVPLATTVDSGVAEVVRKQEAGWAYIKSGS